MENNVKHIIKHTCSEKKTISKQQALQVLTEPKALC